MALKVYKKNDSYRTARIEPIHPEEVEITIQQEEFPTYFERQTNVWGIMSAFYQSLKKAVASSSAAGMIIPSFFILLGLGFVYLQIQPTVVEKVRDSTGYFNQGTTSLVQGQYIETRQQYISNPGSDYFKNLTDEAKASGFREDEQSLNYQGIFYISIPRIGIKRLPVKANVDSGKEDVYKSVLNTSLAHFRGTSLPISQHPGNIVIYGHSVGGSYIPSKSDVVSAFTFLSELQIGDEIIIEMEGKRYTFRTNQTLKVNPKEVSIITGEDNQESLTLFTCWPPGNRSQRQVVIASPIN